MIKRILDEENAKICDEFLTKLIMDEAKYDKTINQFFAVLDYYTNVIKDDKNILLGYYSEDKLVGYLYLKPLKDESLKNQGYLIDALYVLEEYRKRGIAKSLIKKALEIAKEQKATYIDINVIYQNEIAKNLYKSFNFKELKLSLRNYL